MRLAHGLQLGYCTNVHAGESLADVWRALEGPICAVKDKVAPTQGDFGLGLWLSAEAAAELAAPARLAELQHWLREKSCEVFTLNGFPYGKFHGGMVKENVYRPDWTTPERLQYTVRLFDLLAQLQPPGAPLGTVSTLPGSFKNFGLDDSAEEAMFRHLAQCAARIDRLRDQYGRDFVLGLEPEPLGWFENTAETRAFFQKFFRRSDTPRCAHEVIGATYDACHLAVEFEEACESLAALRDAGIRLAKIHLSSALRLKPADGCVAALRNFAEPVYLHQVIVRGEGGALRRFQDLPEALEWAVTLPESARGAEWRVHFHVPLHAAPAAPLEDTRGQLLDVLDFIAQSPQLCPHLEMETYTWAVLPEPLRAMRVEEQIAAEYAWTLGELRRRGLAK